MSEAYPARGHRVNPETGTALVLFAVTAMVALLHGHRFLQSPKLQQWSTVFSAVVLQALPFLVLGVVISGLVAAFVPAEALTRMLPKRAGLGVPLAAVSAAALPGCECSSVPVAARLIDKGAPQPAALAFLLAAPAINPVVTVATAVAFPRHPEMAVARVIASLMAAIVVGWIWSRFGRQLPHSEAAQVAPRGWRQRTDVSLQTTASDFLHAGGYLVIGAALAAGLQILVPHTVLTALPGGGLPAILIMALLAIVLCSLFRSRRLRRRQSYSLFVVGAADLPGGRTHARRQTPGHADRHLRQGFRGAVRPASAGRSDRVRGTRWIGPAMTITSPEKGEAPVGETAPTIVASPDRRAAPAAGIRAGGAVLVLTALVIFRLLWQGRYTSYVRPGMGIPLAVTGVVLAIVGGWGLVGRAPQSHGPDGDEAHAGHGHSALPRICWLLAVPVVVLTLIAPGPLGATSAAGAAPTEVPFHATALHSDSGVVTMKLRDLLGWTTEDHSKRLLGRQLRLVGMAAKVTHSGRLVRLTRFTITCCAADATPFSADVTLPADSLVPPRGGWIEVVGSWNGRHTSDGWPLIDGATVQSIPEPAEPYESDQSRAAPSALGGWELVDAAALATHQMAARGPLGQQIARFSAGELYVGDKAVGGAGFQVAVNGAEIG